jgi:hypothetical protein
MNEKNFWQKLHKEADSTLDPISRISEILFGLIMVLSFTGSISVVSDGKAEISELLWAALGCNLAWGIIDAVFYLMSRVLEKGHGLSVLKKLKLTNDKVTARNMLKDELPPVIAIVLEPEEIDKFKDRLLKIDVLPKSKLITLSDLRVGFFIFLLVFVCTFPVSLPFIFLNNTAFALRASNGVALFILFFGGYSIAKYSGFHPFWTGTILMILGIILVAITMALGG